MTRIVVISDLHIGAGKLDDCDQELERGLVDFLSSLSTDDSPIELVINGDFLDFVQADPWEINGLESRTLTGIPLCFTELHSVSKLKSILQSHKAVFSGLNLFLARAVGNRLVILPGNHDVDFYWPAVRNGFVAAVGSGSEEIAAKIFFHLDQVYRPKIAPGVWIEHGHQYDPINSFFVPQFDATGKKREPKSFWSNALPPIFDDLAGEKRLYECIGTRFLIKFINRLDSEYPFVDNVKPFSRFLKIFGASIGTRGYSLSKPAIAIWSMLRFLGNRLIEAPGDLLNHEQQALNDAQMLLRSLLPQMSVRRQRAMADQLIARGYNLEVPLDMLIRQPAGAESLLNFLVDHPDLTTNLSQLEGGILEQEESGGTLSLAKGFRIDETGALTSAARAVLKAPDVKVVVMGHTHERIDGSDYLNPGCWTRYYTFAPDNATPSWQVLQEQSYKTFPFQMNYVEIRPEETPIAKLKTFRQRQI